MKRKIAAIFAADIAGYSRLVAEDEEETLRRLASYRQVTDDFIAKCGGRIFNTAGDAVLAEFPKVALGAIVIYAALRLIDIAGFRQLARFRRNELLLAFAALAGVLVFGILYGILVSVALSVAELLWRTCLLYTSDAADDLLCVDLGGRRIIKKKNI